jgi:hypothetical protein
MPDLKQLPSIAEAQRSPLVEQLLVQLEHLLEENLRQAEIIQQMRDEIAVLKGPLPGAAMGLCAAPGEPARQRVGGPDRGLRLCLARAALSGPRQGAVAPPTGA